MKVLSCFLMSLAVRSRNVQHGLGMSSQSASDLLYQDQAQAMARRAAYEETLLPEKIASLVPPKSGIKKGFGSVNKINQSTNIAGILSALSTDGVVCVKGAMSHKCTDILLQYILRQQLLVEIETEKNIEKAQSYYGVETQRKNRCDLQLSLLRESSTNHAIADALQQLLGTNGSMRQIYEDLVTLKGEFYELATVITNPGSDRQQFHPDLPYRDEQSPLYVVFLALQDIVEDMGPTTFLLGTHTRSANRDFMDESKKDELIANSVSRIATLKKGDLCLFDARILHCGNANKSKSTRALFNFSFRNAANKQVSLGYKGSMRPNYVGALNLGDVAASLLAYENGAVEPFAKYGDGLESSQ